nr:ribonuclease H-like domain-containing protein [Tanacetum cinerariifolium]
MQKLLNMINDKPSGSIHANMASRASFFNGNVWFTINFSKFFFANSSLSINTITMGWIIDFGANQHLTGSTVGMFNIVDISELEISVRHPNGTLATISHVGNLKLSNNVIVYDVLVVPGYFDLEREKILRTGSESDGLYLFDANKSNSIGQSNMVMTFRVSKVVWHNRLGHPADQVLFVLKKDMNISNNNFVSLCKICQRAKQTREAFPLSDHKSKTLGELVHLDLWGPYRTHSGEGYRYFLIIVDDYSRAVWVYIVKTKDETSCTHTPQQNGIAKRKHRHLLNVARSLMLPSSVLNGMSPFELVYKKKPNLSHLSLNKSIEPTCLSEAMSDRNWVEAMNNVIEALNRNNTWTICDLPAGRKPIGSKIKSGWYKPTRVVPPIEAALMPISQNCNYVALSS